MTIFDQLHPEIDQLKEKLSLSIGPIPAPPMQNSPARLYSHWFMVLGFYVQISEVRQSIVEDSLLDSTNKVAKKISRVMEIEVPSAPRNLNFLLLSSLFQTFSTATAGDNWCVHSAHNGVAAPMDIFRQGTNPELTMNCVCPAHDTKYDIDGTNHLKKV